MSYYRRSDELDPFEKQKKAAEQYREEKERREAEEKAELAAKGGNGRINPLYYIVNAQPAAYADDALMQKNPARYIIKKHGKFLEMIHESYRALGINSSMQIFIRMYMQGLKSAAEVAQRRDDKQQYNVEDLQKQLSEMSTKDGFIWFEKKWREKFPNASFAQSRDDCLADLEKIKSHAQIKRS